MNKCAKNNVVAKKLRGEANARYQKKQFYDALVKYNESLCNAVEGSEDMAFAYANRSAVYFELGYHDKVVSNIQKALRNSYPEEKKKTILARKEKSEKLLAAMRKEEEYNPKDFFKLSYNPNPKYPSFAECIELRKNEKFGRYLITNRDLNVGDIIAIEDFFYYSVKTESEVVQRSSEDSMNYQMCAFCFKSNLLDLEPCSNCVFTMYCSRECYLENLKQNHSMECPLMPFFMMKPSSYNVFKSFFMAFSVCNYSIEELKELIEEVGVNEKSITVFDFDFSKMSERDVKKKLIQILYCGHRRECDDISKAIEFIFTRNPYTVGIFEENMEFVIKFITHLQEIQAQNCYEFSNGIPKQGVQTVCAGDCLCPGLTLLNHSCAPNVLRIDLGKSFALVVIRKIKQGEQLFDCYVKDYVYETKENRQVATMNYGFICDCIACQNDFPMLDDLPRYGPMIEYTEDAYRTIFCLFHENKLTVTLAKKFFNEYVNVMNEKFKFHTYTKDYEMLIECLSSCLTFIAVYEEKIP